MVEKRVILRIRKLLLTPLLPPKKSVTQRGDMLPTIDGIMQLICVDVVDLDFFSESAVAPKYCLVCVDLFTSKAYTYGMKKNNHLPSKLETFFFQGRKPKEISEKRRKASHTSQTDQEFNQNEIKEINKKYNVLHYNSKLNDEHAVGRRTEN